MFTSAKIRNGSTYLENHLSANDYYAKGERVNGRVGRDRVRNRSVFPAKCARKTLKR